MMQFNDLQIIPFEEITKATNNFHKNNYLGGGGFGNVYKGELSRFKERGMVAFKRLDPRYGQGKTEFLKEISMLSQYKQENLISLLGYCNEGEELILVYEYAAHRSLDFHLRSRDLTWTQRLKICLQAAEGLRYLHDPNESHLVLIHRDIKSANILLDEEWNAKVSDFGLSKISPENANLVTYNTGTAGYSDPQYHKTYTLTEKSDVYSFGVTLFEVLCGRLCYDDIGNNELLVFVHMWMESYEQNKIEDIIFKELDMKQIDVRSLKLFSGIAYKCLNESREERPSMAEVVSKLKAAFQTQEDYNLILMHPEIEIEMVQKYTEIARIAVSPVNYTSIEELKERLSEGVLINEGKTWFQLTMNGKHYKMISMAACLRESEPRHFSESESRFTVGSYVPPCNKFMTRIIPQNLSPNITYIMNLVFKKKKPSELYIGLEYEFKDETYYSFLSDERENGWSTAELFQFTTNQTATVDELEVTFNIEYFDVIAIEGIEFRPLDEVEHGVLGDKQMDTQASDTNWRETLQSMDSHGRHYIMLPTRVALKFDGWTWKYLPNTRFEEVPQAPLSKFCISCNIESKILSRDTTYAAYLVYKQEAYNFQPAPAQVKDTNSHSEETLDIYLQIPQTPVIISGEVCQRNRSRRPNIKCIPQPRRDGWMEVQIWEFKTNRNTANIPMDVELSSYDERSLEGLKAKGIEFRPIDNN